MTDEPRGRGRPAGSHAYQPEFATKAAELAECGLTYEEIAAELECDVKTLRRWRRAYPMMEEALQTARDAVDDDVEAALVEDALGGKYEEEQAVGTRNGVEVVTVRRRRHGNGQSQRWWLANRRPKEWSLTPRGARKALNFGVIDGSAKSISEAGVNVLRLMAAGELSVEEGQAAATVLAAVSRAIEVGVLEDRIAELEGAPKQLPAPRS